MKLLTLDPSVNNVGFALFDTKAKSQINAWRWGTWHPQGFNLEMKMTDLVQTIDAQIGHFDWLCTERPAFYNSEKGMIAAHQNYTIDLAAVAYFVAGWYHMDHRHHWAITATAWKGTVNKTITARRFFRSFPHVKPKELDEHAIDAIMLGRFCVEQFLCNLPKGKLDRKVREIIPLLG